MPTAVTKIKIISSKIGELPLLYLWTLTGVPAVLQHLPRQSNDGYADFVTAVSLL